jgi:hypothetical protein
MFHQPIFSRMIGNDRQPSSGLECVTKCRQSLLQTFQLLVHGNAHCLKEPSEVTRAGPRTQGGPNGVDKVIARPEALPFPTAYDLGGQTPGPSLVSILAENVLEGRYISFIQKPTSIAPARSHAHVERGPRTEGKTAVLLVQLPG